jgi:YidC/Oxa1 family membrane protein insertase
MPNNPRIYLWIALALLLWLNYQAWMRDYAPQSLPATQAAQSRSPAPPDLSTSVPRADASASAAGAAASGAAPGAAPPAAASAAADTAPRVHVRTDVLDVDISTRGGTIERVSLLKYPLVKGQAAPVTLENDNNPVSRYLLQSGFTGPSPGQGSYPDHMALLTPANASYELDGNQNELRVPLTWSNGHGLTFTKTFVFQRGQYRVDLQQEIANASKGQPVQVAAYAQILRNDPRTKGSWFDVESRSYHGPVFFDGSRYRRLDLSPDGADAHLSKEVTGGWIAASQHHFVTAVVPPTDLPMRVTMSVQGDQYLLAATGPTKVVDPGTSARTHMTLFIGPMLQNELDAVGPKLSLVTDYGYLSILSQPLFSLLNWVHRMSGNWGIAIILVTFLLKLVFYPLQESAGRSMAKMKNLGPRIKNLQETYKDDREKLGTAMMELYRREKVNPVAGCLPILIQIPVFIAFYWVLLQSVEMRQAPFLFWIRDLSSRDPWFVLPAIMAGAMFLQYRMNPPSPDPTQAKVFMVMPFVMSFTFAFFPAGLVLYWVTNTLLSIAQQWNINRRLEVAGHKA